MTETEKKALALVNEVRDAGDDYCEGLGEAIQTELKNALLRAIEQHEAFKLEVSDAIDSSVLTPETEAHLSRFIVAKPDPLVEAINSAPYLASAKETADHIRAAIEARGGRIVWEGE